jgi:hypothetical protein
LPKFQAAKDRKTENLDHPAGKINSSINGTASAESFKFALKLGGPAVNDRSNW